VPVTNVFMRKFVAAVAVLLAGASMMMAAGDPTLLGAAESGDHAAAMRLLSAKGTNVNATAADGTTAIIWDDLLADSPRFYRVEVQ